MQVPIELSFRDVDHDDIIEQKIRDHAEALERIHPRITSCRITVEKPQEHMQSGRPWRVRLDITVPHGNEIVVRKEPGKGNLHEPLSAVINSAFDAAERQLLELKERQRWDVKVNAMDGAIGIVKNIHREEGYGFITDESEQDIYFHRNAVLEDAFDRVEPGTAVWYNAEIGDDGLQATSVRIHDKPSM